LNGLVRNSIARLHRPYAHRHVAVAGDEDDRHVGPLGELLLQLEAVESRQRHVEDEAAGNSGARAGEKGLRRRKHLGVPTSGLDQQLQRFAHRDVIVDDEDEG
jgi:hypothetical protein